MNNESYNNESYNINSVPPSTRPEHHLHDTSDRLPGVNGAAPTVDYRVDTMDRTSSEAWNNQPNTTHHPTNHTGLDSTKPPMARSDSAKGNTAFETERPLGVKPAPEGQLIKYDDGVDIVLTCSKISRGCSNWWQG